MTKTEIDAFVNLAEEVYDRTIRNVLARSHLNDFVAIEPMSGRYFLGHSMRDATDKARQSLSGQPTHFIRIGHKAALNM